MFALYEHTRRTPRGAHQPIATNISLSLTLIARPCPNTPEPQQLFIFARRTTRTRSFVKRTFVPKPKHSKRRAATSVFLLYCEWVDQIAPNPIVTGGQFYLQIHATLPNATTPLPGVACTCVSSDPCRPSATPVSAGIIGLGNKRCRARLRIFFFPARLCCPVE